jgi:hypothetical protein
LRNGHLATRSSWKQVILVAGAVHDSRINPALFCYPESIRHTRRQPVPMWRGLTPMSVRYSIVECRLSLAKTDGLGSIASIRFASPRPFEHLFMSAGVADP